VPPVITKVPLLFTSETGPLLCAIVPPVITAVPLVEIFTPPASDVAELYEIAPPDMVKLLALTPPLDFALLPQIVPPSIVKGEVK